ncbi:glutamyl-tRNA(Gln) amidotransferase [Colletotrichum abscissum]|uniref:Glutamyl-tRNA(Gln) amidotransferase n=1 Tax=Colletotrichum abscissum TaxID=1671311 RepID=A0A9P9XRL6_9PEZI|nr:glutamyl-tRNA(Gln) amidotransferase [Colletotrichum abscissum]KAI3558027.1 glutamyl-tRNA(Gln) amidotransferase [Colletotrichum abscissum]KAK1482848.1 glutamyl-tRNA(Gln) amidotransferase [Colletotrichum abscissum]
MLVRKVPVLAPVNDPEFGASNSSPSTHAPLLDYFPPTREAQIRCHQSATSSPSPAVVRIKTVIELGTKAFVIRGQPNLEIGESVLQLLASLHGPSSASSDDVQRVIDLGGVIVGKTKTVEFGGSQEVIGDWCDYFDPMNVRGDGYLAGTGSSTGSVSRLAAYPWLDTTLGTDGKLEHFALLSTLLEAKHEIDETAGIFHTPGFLGRDIRKMHEFGRHWLQNSSKAEVSTTNAIDVALTDDAADSEAETCVVPTGVLIRPFRCPTDC